MIETVPLYVFQLCFIFFSQMILASLILFEEIWWSCKSTYKNTLQTLVFIKLPHSEVCGGSSSHG